MLISFVAKPMAAIPGEDAVVARNITVWQPLEEGEKVYLSELLGIRDGLWGGQSCTCLFSVYTDI